MPDTLLKEVKSLKNPLKGTSWPERAYSAAMQHQTLFAKGVTQFSNLEMARERAAFTRWKSIENLDKYLIEFESNFIRSGGKVFWAQDITDVLVEVLNILKKASVRQAVKSKSQVLNETGVQEALTNEGIDTLETDTADFILQQFEEEGSHMVLPALHKSLKEIAQLFTEKFNLPDDADASDIVNEIRNNLREEFLGAGAGITGANFLVADPGAIVITENEGNAWLCSSLPKIHIVIAGIEKILPTLNDLDLFLPLLSTYGTGQELTAYNNIITGPRQQDEVDGPEELYIILLDNGRSDVLSHEIQRQAMSCIKCGACQYTCPVYRSAGPSLYPSPVEAVITPLQKNTEQYQHLSYDATLCSSSQQVCPVKIDLSRLLIHNRKLFVDQGLSTRAEKWFYFLWKKAMLKRDIMNWKGLRAGKYIMENLYHSKSGLRKLPGVAAKSFNEQWREKMNYK